MKKLVLAVVLSATSMSVFAQKSVSIAQKALKKGQLTKASELIKLALKEPKANKKAKTWLLKANIYDSLAVNAEQMTDAKKYIVEAVKGYEKYAQMKGGVDKAFSGSKFGNDLLQIANRGGLKATPQLFLGQRFAQRAYDAYKAKNYKKAQEQFFLAGLSNKKDTSSYENAIKMVYQTKPIDYNAIQEMSKSMIKSDLKTPFAYQALLEATKQVDKKNLGNVLQEARKQHPDYQNFMLEEINYYISEGKTDEAIMNLEKAAKNDPSNASLQLNLGLLYEQTKKPDLAVKSYEKAYELNKNDYNTVYSLGAFHFNQGVTMKNEGAKLGYEEYKTKGKAFEEKSSKLFEKALPYFEKALTLKKDEEQLLNALYSIYSQLKKKDKAQEIKSLIDKL